MRERGTYGPYVVGYYTSSSTPTNALLLPVGTVQCLLCVRAMLCHQDAERQCLDVSHRLAVVADIRVGLNMYSRCDNYDGDSVPYLSNANKDLERMSQVTTLAHGTFAEIS
jgi:hypothetical protein